MAKVSTFSHGLKWGIIAALVIIIINVVLYVLGLSGNQAAGLLILPILFGLIFFSVKTFRDANGTMSVGQGLGVGLLTGIVAGIFAAIYNYVFMTFIDPSMMATVMEAQEQALYERGLSDDEIEQSLEMMKTFSSPGIASIFSLISTGILSLLFSLVPAFVLKRTHDSKY